jgi:hypothetical protein
MFLVLTEGYPKDWCYKWQYVPIFLEEKLVSRSVGCMDGCLEFEHGVAQPHRPHCNMANIRLAESLCISAEGGCRLYSVI